MALRRLTCGSLLAAALISSCGGASFEQHVFDDGRVRYRIGARPLGYTRVKVEDFARGFAVLQTRAL